MRGSRHRSTRTARASGTPNYVPDGSGIQDPLFLSPANTDALNLIQKTLDCNVLTSKQVVQDARHR